MSTTPTLPPQPWFDPNTGNATEPFRRHYEALWKNAGSPTNDITANVNSGVAQARADAASAQATADAASQQAQDVGSATMSFYATSSLPVVSGTRLGPGVVTTNSVTVTPTGGTGPYIYAWTYVSGDTFTVNSPTAAATTFSISLAVGESKSAVYRCTVTDSLAATTSVTVGVSASELS